MKSVSPPAGSTSASQTSPGQIGQRVRVGMIGLAAVVLLIGLASAIFSAVNRESAGAGAPIMANMTVSNGATAGSEPLAELGVAPSTVDANAVLPAEPAK